MKKTFFLMINCFFASGFCDLPIVFIHSGYSTYLGITLEEAAKKNNSIILLSDKRNKFISKNAFFYEMSQYGNWAEKFSKIYFHMSSTNLKFELFCFNRWFILYEFMKRQKIEKCFYCDSDVMVYCNIENNLDLAYELLLIGNRSQGLSAINGFLWAGGTIFWDIKILKDFCEFIFEYYQDKEKLNKLKNLYYQRSNLNHAICDMTLFSLFYEERKNKLKIGNLAEESQGKKFDHHLQSSEDNMYRMKETKNFLIKDIKFIEEEPFCFNIKTSEWVKVLALHFQGGANELINDYRTN